MTPVELSDLIYSLSQVRSAMDKCSDDVGRTQAHLKEMQPISCPGYDVLLTQQEEKFKEQRLELDKLNTAAIDNWSKAKTASTRISQLERDLSYAQDNAAHFDNLLNKESKAHKATQVRLTGRKHHILGLQTELDGYRAACEAGGAVQENVLLTQQKKRIKELEQALSRVQDNAIRFDNLRNREVEAHKETKWRSASQSHQISGLQAELNDYRTTCKSDYAKRENERLRGDIERLTKQINRCKRECSEAESACEQFKATANRYRSDLGIVRDECRKTITDREHYRTSYNAVRNELDLCKRERHEARCDAAEWKIHYAAAKKERLPTIGTATYWKERFDIAEGERGILKRELTSLRAKLDIEKLAKAMHSIWASWMKWLFSSECGSEDMMAGGGSGPFTIKSEKVARWKRQLNTLYVDLPDGEKESDRKVAREHLAWLLAGGSDGFICPSCGAETRAHEHRIMCEQCAWSMDLKEVRGE